MKDLKDECKERGLSVSGTKAILVDRLLESGDWAQAIKIVQTTVPEEHSSESENDSDLEEIAVTSDHQSEAVSDGGDRVIEVEVTGIDTPVVAPQLIKFLSTQGNPVRLCAFVCVCVYPCMGVDLSTFKRLSGVRVGRFAPLHSAAAFQGLEQDRIFDEWSCPTFCVCLRS